jgi:hypothetical protein
VARPDDSGEYREGDPGVFIGGRLGARPLGREEGKGGGSSRLGMPRDRADGTLGAALLRGDPAEPTEPELSDSECRSEGSEVSLAKVGLRGWVVGGELQELWVASMG